MKTELANFSDASQRAEFQGYNDYSPMLLGRLSNNLFKQDNSFRANMPVLTMKQMAAKFADGTLNSMDVLGAWKIWVGQVLEYDRVLLGEQQAMLLEAANHNTAEQLDIFCNISTERLVHNDSVDTQPVMTEGGENMIPTAVEAVSFGSDQGFSLRRFGIGLQWNESFWDQKDMRMYATTMSAILAADTNLIGTRIRRAFFHPTNTTFYDKLDMKAKLNVCAFVNGTGGAAGNGYIIPPAPYNQQTFNSATHSHYMYPGSGNFDNIAGYTSYAWSNGSATPATRQADMQAYLLNIREHWNDSTCVVYVSQQDASTYFAATGSATLPNSVLGFTHLQYLATIEPSKLIDQPKGPGFNTSNQYDRLMGYFDNVEIHVKPWVPVGYFMTYNPNAGKPLQVRVPKGKHVGPTASGSLSMGNGDLRTVQAYTQYPLHAQAMIRDFDVSVGNIRENGCVMYINSSSSYTAPAGM